MKRRFASLIALLASFALVFCLAACSEGVFEDIALEGTPIAEQSEGIEGELDESALYYDTDNVAAYIHEFGHLPDNFISKTKARKAGWVNTEGNLWDVLPGMCIGGSDYHNDDGALPDAPGRRWTECDVNYEGGFRGPERIVFSNDGLIYYTPDHYLTFELLY